MATEPQRITRRPLVVVLFTATVVMVGFIFALVWLNYSSAKRVRGALIMQVARETEKRAIALEYFFSERRDNLMEISLSRELNVYFENKALGMSMDYGLRQSLPPIHERLGYYLQNKRIAGTPIFSRFVFIEQDGTVLIDTASPEAGILPHNPLRSCLMPELRRAEALVWSDGWEVVLSQAHYFKDAYVGQILAWVNGDPLRDHILGDRGDDRSFMLLEATRRDAPLGWMGTRTRPLPPLEDLQLRTMLKFRGSFDDREYLAVRAPVLGTPFELLQVVATHEILGRIKPWHNLVALGTIALAILVGAALSIRLYLRSRILSVHLAESVERERLVSEKNLELQQEIVERTKAQESMQILRMSLEEISLESLLGKALEGMREISWLGGREECAVHLWDEQGQVAAAARMGAARDCGPCSLTDSRETWDSWARARNGLPAFVRDTDDDHPSHCDVRGAHGHIWLPLMSVQQWIGVLSLTTRHGHTPNENAMRFLSDFAGVLSFVIQRRRAVEELRVAHQANRTLIHAIPLALITLDAEGRILRFNPAAESLFDRTAFDVVGREIGSSGLSWDFAALPNMLAAVSPGATTIREVPFTRPDGREGFLSVVLSAITDSGPNAAAKVLIVGSDVTEQRQLEAQILMTRKLEAIGQMAAGLAHEINTPSQYIETNLQFLLGAFEDLLGYLGDLDGVAAALPADAADRLTRAAADRDIAFAREDVPKALRESVEGVKRISEIVAAMKEFSRDSALELGSVDLNRALASTITVTQSAWKRVCEVRTEFADDLPFVQGRAVELNQALLNIIMNAVQAIEDASASDRGLITVATRQAGEMAEVRISDTGNGIPAKIRDRVFDPFFTTRTVGSGTGQGLTLARSIVVDQHRGELTFETAEGQGTTFVIRLPAA